MAAPSVTNQLENGSDTDASKLNRNFDDIVNALSDGTSDITVSTIVADTATVGTGTFTNTNIDDAAVSAMTCAGTGSVGHMIVNSALTSGVTPATNTVYSNSLVKGWAYTLSTGTVQAAFNLTCTVDTAAIYHYAFLVPCSDTNYCVLGRGQKDAQATPLEELSRSVDTFTVYYSNWSGSLTAAIHQVVVFGT